MTVSDLIPTNYGSGTSAAPYNGSKLWNTAPNGYTVGPNYWGMTFFTWPPDPEQRLAPTLLFELQRHSLVQFPRQQHHRHEHQLQLLPHGVSE